LSRISPLEEGSRRGRDRMVVGFITIYAINAYDQTTNVVSSNPTQEGYTRYNIM